MISVNLFPGVNMIIRKGQAQKQQNQNSLDNRNKKAAEIK